MITARVTPRSHLGGAISAVGTIAGNNWVEIAPYMPHLFGVRAIGKCVGAVGNTLYLRQMALNGIMHVGGGEIGVSIRLR